MSEIAHDAAASEESLLADVKAEGVTGSEIFSDMLRHMMAPLLIGMVFGAIWQLTVMPRIDTFVPNPVHGAFAMYLLASPLIYKQLVGMEMNRAGEYAMGFAATACFLSLVWMFGTSSVYLAGFLPAIAWLFISSFWLQFEFPPFRYGLWHGMAVNVGAFGGSVLAFIYF
ncbi:MAG: hypothetical protein ACO3NJ_06820 [Candidatus Poseidoniaceae archaeon]